MATKSRLDIKADVDLVKRLDKLAGAKGLKSRTAAIAYLLDAAQAAPDAQVATQEVVFADTRPMVVAGPSGSGKTYTTMRLLSSVDAPAFVLDPSGEYTDGFRKVGYDRVSSIRWRRGGRYSCRLKNDVEVSKSEAYIVFRALNLARARGLLVEWIIVIEEAHRFADDPELISLVLEARKSTKKVLILTAQPDSLAKLAPVFRPLPRKEVEA